MEQTKYLNKQNEILSASHFEARNGGSEVLKIKTKKLINSSLYQLISQAWDNWIGTVQVLWTIRYVKAVCRSGLFCHYPVAVGEFNKFLSPIFERLRGAKIETNSKDARAPLEDTKLD